MGNQESETLGTYIIENCRDVHMSVFMNFKSYVYKIIIHVVVQRTAEITGKHSIKQNLFPKYTFFFFFFGLYFLNTVKDIHKPQRYIKAPSCFLYSLLLDIMVACFLAFVFKSLLNELSEFLFPVPLFSMILHPETPKKEPDTERRQGRGKHLGHSLSAG